MKTDYKTFEKKMTETNLVYVDGQIKDQAGNTISEAIISMLWRCTETEFRAAEKSYLDEQRNKIIALNSTGSDFDNEEIPNLFNAILDHEGLKLDMASGRFFNMISGQKNLISPVVFDEIIAFRTNDWKLNNTQSKINEKIMIQYTNVIITKLMAKKQIEIKKSIMFSGDAQFADLYLTRMHKIFDIQQDLDIFITLMKHFVWQIKRRSTGRKTYYDIMIAFFGAQGIGKSYVMNAIFGTVFQELYAPSITLQDILEKNNAKLLIDKYLINIEELAKSGDALNSDSGAAFKKLLTDENITYRPFFTQKQVTEPIRTSFLSTANKHIQTLINDPTGMRRFFEFVSQLEPNNVIADSDTKWLEQNALKLFQSVDEDIEKGYWRPDSDIGIRITEIQNSYALNPTTEWIKNTYCKNENLKLTDCPKLKDLYSDYEDYYASTDGDKKYKKSKDGFVSLIESAFGVKNLCGTTANTVRYRLELKDKSKEKDIVRYKEPDSIEASVQAVKKTRTLGNTIGII